MQAASQDVFDLLQVSPAQELIYYAGLNEIDSMRARSAKGSDPESVTVEELSAIVRFSKRAPGKSEYSFVPTSIYRASNTNLPPPIRLSRKFQMRCDKLKE
jgi:hypothetical protein